MGGCCFTPTKRDFLWWYWLLLASIVGIPMLLAVIYVANSKETDEETKRRRGRAAAWIFWLGTLVVALAMSFLARFILLVIYPEDVETYFWTGRRAYTGYAILAMQFFFATVAANGANNLIRKLDNWVVRIFLLLVCLGMYLFVLMCLSFWTDYIAVNVMQFLVCMLSAHHWGKFKDSPDTSHAWKALGAFVASALLFFIVSYFGVDFAKAIYG